MSATPVIRPQAGMLVSERVRLLRELGGGGMAEVWVAEHLTLGIEVAVKFLRRPDDPAARQRLSREAQLAARIDHPHAVRVYDHGEMADGTPLIVMELVEGESLGDRLDRAGPLGLDDVRRLVRQVAQVLAAAHAQGIVHRDIKPDNIMLLARTEELFAKVVDFGIAKRLESQETTDITADGHVVGTPLYMAPEQLLDGHPADVRSDLWGLGLVAYEALVARRPFAGRTRAAIGVAMALHRFERVSAIQPSLPAELDEWFERALRLEARERFASADELARTFDVASRGEGTPAPPRAHRASGLRISSAVYGRERELATLRAAFARASEGRSQVVLVSGYPGIGKTSLVASAQQALVGSRGTFVSGKFDQFDRGTPYQSLIEAFRRRIRRTLQRGRDTVDAFRERIAAGLGESGPALVDVIPELEDLLGPRLELEAVPPNEARNRFQIAMGRLVTAMASAEAPLVVFVDDLQWADLASLDLVTSLATDPESRHVLLLGAYRDGEVDETHPLASAIERMRSVGAALAEITLGPLGEDAVFELVSDTFPGASGRVRFAALCREKTRGNAFFLKRFLESLYEEGTVRFEQDEQRWTWDLAAIEERALSEEVVDFVLAEIRRMPPRSRGALEAASCIGDQFDLETLSVALRVEPSAALELIRPALASELLTPLADPSIELEVAHRRSSLERDPAADSHPMERRLALRFAHDRIRQAARASIDEDAATEVHRTVGLHLLESLGGAEREQRLFEVVEHLNRGFAPGSGHPVLGRLRALDLLAARRALASAAFQPAHGFYEAARARLAEDAWSSDYEQTLAIHVEGARAAYLSGAYDTMASLVAAAVANGREVLDRVGAREVTLQSHVSQQRFGDAVSLAVELLGELGAPVPAAPDGADVARAVGETLGVLGDCTPERIDRLTMVTDPRIAAIQRIQNGTMSSAYLAAPNLLPILACSIVRSTLEHGVCKESPYGFAVFALVLTAINQIAIGYSTGRLALKMLDRIGERSLRPKTLHVMATHVAPFVEPLRGAIEADRRAVRIGMDTGDLEYAAWGLHCMVCNAFYAGVELDEVGKVFERHRAALVHHKQLAALGCTVQYGQAVANLTGKAVDPTRLVGPDYDETRHLAELTAINFRGAAFIVTAVGTFVRYLFDDPRGAVELADVGGPYADGAVATYHLVWWHQYRALAVLASVDPSSASDVAAALANVEANLAQLRIWQGFSPVNHDHRVHLVEAEIARVEGRAAEALAHLDAAAAAAGEHRFVHEEALAHELAGRLHRGADRTNEARARFRQALAAHDRWGATAKSARLRDALEALGR